MTQLSTQPSSGVAPYSALASVYDVVMDHVDYHQWASYIFDLVRELVGKPQRILELGCGTGSFAFEFVELFDCDYYATDGSPDMIRVARQKAEQLGSRVTFEIADFVDLAMGDVRFDLVLLLYDGINYLTSTRDVGRTLQEVRSVLKSGGFFVFDQSTPANSLNNAAYFGDSGGGDDVSYVRRSRFDEAADLHHTEFDLVIDGEQYSEHHVQRIYTMHRMEELVKEAGFDVVAGFEDFTRLRASDKSERIQWVLRSP